VTKLPELPAKVDALTGQILHLRGASADGLRTQLLDEIGKMHALTMAQIIDLGDRLDAGFAGMRAEVRTFREEMLAGLKMIQDRLPPR